ncbi:cytochrome c-type biogenesis protein CcmE [Salinibacterium sp. CAN_S4]|jgi:cytochrome c-type biogenesis protein CcmE
MTLHKDQDPGWWRRGMSSRAITITVVVCVVAIVVGLAVMAFSGISFF